MLGEAVGASDIKGGGVGNPNIYVGLGVSGLAEVGGGVVGEGLIATALQILSQPPQ